MKTINRVSIVLIVLALITLVFGYGSQSGSGGYVVLFLGYPLLIIGVIVGLVGLFSNKK